MEWGKIGYTFTAIDVLGCVSKPRRHCSIKSCLVLSWFATQDIWSHNRVPSLNGSAVLAFLMSWSVFSCLKLGVKSELAVHEVQEHRDLTCPLMIMAYTTVEVGPG